MVTCTSAARLRSRLAFVWCLGALAATDCGHTQLLCPRQAGPEWRHYDSPHFAVTTDLPPSRARPLVGEFERTYRSFLDVTGWRFPGRGEPPGRMRVVIFARRSDYEAVAPPHTDGFYRSESLDGTHAPGEVFLHELTHRLIRYYVPNAPLGLNEGLAEYFSTFVVEKGAAQTGLPPRRLISNGRGPLQLPSVRVLLTIDSLQGLSDQQVNAFYMGGWFLVHTMARFYPQQLGTLLARMADGDSFPTALVACFGHDPWTMLNARYLMVIEEAYRMPDRLSVPSWRKPYEAAAVVEPVEQEQTVGDAALHLLWADLQRGRRDVAAQVALAEAHGGDSAQLAFMRGLLHLQRKELPAAERDLAAAVDARPDDERYRLTLARVHALAVDRDPAQGLAAMARDMDWLAANAQGSDALALVALFFALRGELATARTHVKHALTVDPTNARGYFALAVIDANQGDIDGAIEAAERSLRLTPEGYSGAPAKELLGQLRARRASRRPSH